MPEWKFRKNYNCCHFVIHQVHFLDISDVMGNMWRFIISLLLFSCPKIWRLLFLLTQPLDNYSDELHDLYFFYFFSNKGMTCCSYAWSVPVIRPDSALSEKFSTLMATNETQRNFCLINSLKAIKVGRLIIDTNQYWPTGQHWQGGPGAVP